MSTRCFIRQARVEDEEALYQICLKTAKAGNDASDVYSDPHYPGQLYVVPYARFEPELAFVLICNEQVVGYAVATSNTRQFEQTLENKWWPVLRRAYANREEQKPFDNKVLNQIRHPHVAAQELVSKWPAHLHINLLPQVQSGGWGSKLISAVVDALQKKQAPGVHLGVSLQNEKVCEFYKKQGFTHIIRSNAIYMGREL
ncbi:GNAT family N-acetyltransferase [Vibrio sp. MEBiC08052]|uniref:GNAT family N-acetyltransferase n=1 Tax=Vibrio sp. MEBiC08052 TaxID=1761910 RepID=UPI0007406129|nr:GNAT family N-acetyltransferase [Vibrio sp. MEBiC08052]KUI96599.1 hypothetical protein VRK_42940 [Vibrio sp. MEBiC08052]